MRRVATQPRANLAARARDLGFDFVDSDGAPGADSGAGFLCASLPLLDLDSAYHVIHQASVSYTVQALVNGLQIISPTPNENMGMTTVHVVAHATESVPINQMQVWDNGAKLGWYAGADVNQYFTLGPGSHNLTVMDLDSSYNLLHKSSVSYSVQ